MTSIECAQLCQIVSTKQSSSPAKATILGPKPRLPRRLHGRDLNVKDSIRESINEALKKELSGDKSAYLIGEDIREPGGSFGVTHNLVEKFGQDRVMDTPISEAAIVGSSAGATLTGSQPIAEIMYADFMSIAVDQVLNQAGLFKYCSVVTSPPL